MIEDIFSIENDLLIINKDYCRGISEFRTILERDRGSEGDAQGRKKLKAFQEFMYVYIVASLYSYPNRGGYSDKDTHIAAIKESKLEEKFKPDADLKLAIDKYKEIQITSLPTLRVINTILKTLHLSQSIAQNITDSMEATIELQNQIKKNKVASGEAIDIAQELAITNGLMSQLDQAIKISNKIPNTINTLEELYEKLKREESKNNVGRGGKKIGNRAEPKIVR